MTRLAALVALALAGCYDPTIADGTYLCPDKVCPSGQQCSGCGQCIREGEPASTGCRTCADAVACVEAMGCPLMTGNSCIDGCFARTTTEARTEAEAVLACERTSCNVRCSGGLDLGCRACRANAVRGAGSPLGACTPGDDPACGKCVAPYQACAAP